MFAITRFLIKFINDFSFLESKSQIVSKSLILSRFKISTKQSSFSPLFKSRSSNVICFLKRLSILTTPSSSGSNLKIRHKKKNASYSSTSTIGVVCGGSLLYSGFANLIRFLLYFTFLPFFITIT